MPIFFNSITTGFKSSGAFSLALLVHLIINSFVLNPALAALSFILFFYFCVIIIANTLSLILFSAIICTSLIKVGSGFCPLIMCPAESRTLCLPQQKLSKNLAYFYGKKYVIIASKAVAKGSLKSLTIGSQMAHNRVLLASRLPCLFRINFFKGFLIVCCYFW